MFEAEAVIHDGNGDRRETMYTQLDWQLLDQRRPKLEYYETLFSQIENIIGHLPEQRPERKEILTGLLGSRHLSLGKRIVNRQSKRFTR
jgi:hypothetical protein